MRPVEQEGMAQMRDRVRADRLAAMAARREQEIADLTERVEAMAVGEEFRYTDGQGGNRQPEIERHEDGFTVRYHIHEKEYADARTAAEFIWNEGDDGEPYGWTGLGNGFE